MLLNYTSVYNTLSLTSDSGVPVINVGMFFAHVYRVRHNYIDYILYRKDVGIGIVYRGKPLVEAIAKAPKTYDTAVERARWMEHEKRVGKLVIPLDSNGKPLRGDKQSAEGVLVEV